jgi:hypothetical protein
MTTPAQKPRSVELPPSPGVAGARASLGRESPPTAPQLQHAAIDPQVAALSQLLRIEGEARQTQSEAELSHLIANETRNLVRARQAFVARRKSKEDYRVATVSSLAQVDQNAPMIQWIGRLLRGLSRGEDCSRVLEFALPAYADPSDTMTASYPFPCFLWVPMWARVQTGDDGILLARETPWLEADKRIAVRLAETYGHALLLHRSRPRREKFRVPVRATTLALAGAICAAGFVPVPMTALAPLEISARNPQIVTMPADGIVQQVLVEPNTTVVPGQRLVQLSDTIARNKLELSEREVLVAAARLEKASSLSFSDPRGRHDLGIAGAELALKKAERDFAKSIFDRTVLVARKAGVAVFSDRKDLEGKPLSAGDKVMMIVDPGAVELTINLAVADSVVLEPGARVKAFIDSDPMRPLEATVAHVDYQARVSESGVATYHLVAVLTAGERPSPQLGVRGTAQLYGPDAPLAVFILRRPLSAIRQWIGL